MSKPAVLSMPNAASGAGHRQWEMLTLPVLSLPSQCDQTWGSHTLVTHPSHGGEVMMFLSIPRASLCQTLVLCPLLCTLGESAKYNLGWTIPERMYY